ncbi:MAG: hypothetical protein LBQ27_02555 [Clostridiales bacterium]|jgi:protein arginine kinase activator|nr:hypothetical protein [Clostridiales bacterium]
MERCMICKESYANLRYYEEIDGKSREFFICTDCYGKFKDGREDCLSEFNMFSDILYRKKEENKVCKRCGTSLKEFYKTSFVGCQECYDAFRGEMSDIAKEL